MAEDRLLDHEFDGIQEYDNPCPGWWHLLFWGSVVFSIMYFMFFHLGTSGWTLADSYQSAMADNVKLRFAEIGILKPDQPTLLEYMQKPDWLAVGKGIFLTNCKSCHGADGEGLVGPNLTDDHYKNVKTLTDIAKVIEDGAANGSMPAWRNRLSHPNEIVLVAAYAASLRGQNKSGRGPEGELIPPWPKAPPPAAAKPTTPAKS